MSETDIKLREQKSAARYENHNLCLAVALCSGYRQFSGMTIRPSLHGRSEPILTIFSFEKSGYPVQEPDCRLVPHAALILPSGTYRIDVRKHIRPDITAIDVQPVMPSDGLACHLKVYGVLVLMPGLRNAQGHDMTAHGIEHREVSEQFHTDEVRLFGMKTDSAKGILQFPEAGLDIPAHVIQLFHTLNGKLEPVQVRDQDFPLFLAGVFIIDTKFHHTTGDIAELPEIPSMIDRILRVMFRMGFAFRIDQMQVRVCFMILGVEMVRCGDTERDFFIAFLIGKLPYLLDVSGLYTDGVITVRDAVQGLEHVEPGIAPVHDDDERGRVIQAFHHVDGSVTLIGTVHGLHDTVLIGTVHQVK